METFKQDMDAWRLTWCAWTKRFVASKDSVSASEYASSSYCGRLRHVQLPEGALYFGIVILPAICPNLQDRALPRTHTGYSIMSYPSAWQGTH